jgi:hypothetical protein
LFLSDIQNVRSQFLQLTAGDGDQEGVQTGVPEEYWEAYGSHEELCHIENNWKVLPGE